MKIAIIVVVFAIFGLMAMSGIAYEELKNKWEGRPDEF